MPKSKKAQKKSTTAIKSGHPAKIAEQRAALEDYKKAKQNHIRTHKAISKDKAVVPQNVGSIYQPPPNVEPLEDYVPTYTPTKTATKAKKGKVANKLIAWGIVAAVGGSLVVSSLAIPDAATQNMVNQQNSDVALDENGNALPAGEDNSMVLDPPSDGKQVAEFTSEDVTGGKEAEKEPVTDK